MISNSRRLQNVGKKRMGCHGINEIIRDSITVILQEINVEVSHKKKLIFVAVNFGKGRFYVLYKLDRISVRMPV